MLPLFDVHNTSRRNKHKYTLLNHLRYPNFRLQQRLVCKRAVHLQNTPTLSEPVRVQIGFQSDSKTSVSARSTSLSIFLFFIPLCSPYIQAPPASHFATLLGFSPLRQGCETLGLPHTLQISRVRLAQCSTSLSVYLMSRN